MIRPHIRILWSPWTILYSHLHSSNFGIITCPYSSHIANLTRSCQFLLFKIRSIFWLRCFFRGFKSVNLYVLFRSVGLPLSNIWTLRWIQNSAESLVLNLTELPLHTIATLPPLASRSCPCQIETTFACLQSQNWTITYLPESTYYSPHCTTLTLIL